jgi:alcohol dehydrogenase (cytochrome c)
VISKIDGATGEVTVNDELTFSKINESHLTCPGSTGGKNWPAGAYSPQTNTMYFPLQNLCQMATTTTDQRDPSKVYGINMVQQLAPGTEKVGSVWAISAESGQTVWKQEQRAGALSLMTTGGGLVFGGDANGRFRAFDDKTGRILWEVNLGAPVSGFPISYSVGGKQFVAVSTGTSLVASTALRVASELKPGTGSNIFVFALP